MDINELRNMLSIPTYFGREELIKEYITKFAISNNICTYTDMYGNLYLIKGELSEGEYYPCVAAHIDTVYRNQVDLINENDCINITETYIEDNNDTYFSSIKGVGGDDKSGVFICLQLILRFNKLVCAFFVEEEFGCNGSNNSDRDFFKNIGYVVQFDAPTDNWCSEMCSGIKLYNDESFNLIKPVLDKYNITNISRDPYTDVAMLRLIHDFVCFNFFAGYYNQHRGKLEYVSCNDVSKAIEFGVEIITVLGNEKRLYFTN